MALIVVSAAAAQDWPRLLGPDGDGSLEGVRIEPWSAAPKERWSFEIGSGFAGAAIAEGKVLVFHRQPQDQETLQALDLGDGSLLWTARTPTAYRDDFGFDDGPRAVPSISDGRVFTVGAQGVLGAWELESGRELWQRDTRGDFDVPKGFFGVAASPLVTGDQVLLNVGGANAGIVAFDVATGETIWTHGQDEQSYAGPAEIRIQGRELALFFTREGLVVLDPANGEEVGRFAHKTRIRSSVNAATPLVVADRVFLSAEYGAGAVLLSLSDPAKPRVVWESGDTLNNHYATSVHRRGVLYGYHGRQEAGPALRAVELETGRTLWSEPRFGAGSVLIAEDQLLLLTEDGELVLASARRSGYEEKGRAKVLDGVVRAFPAYSAGLLVVRGPDRLVALELPLESSD